MVDTLVNDETLKDPLVAADEFYVNAVGNLNRKGRIDGIRVTASQVSDFDTEVANNADVTANTAKTTNQTHTGEVTGATALVVDATAITGQTEEAAPVSGDFLLGYDTTAGALRKFDVGNLPAGGGGINNIVEDTTPQLGGDLDGNGFDINLDAGFILSFDTGTQAQKIVGDAGGITHTVPTGDTHDFIVNATTTLALSETAAAVTGNITVSGTVDGRDIASDGSKLDGIEALADVTDITNVNAAAATTVGTITSGTWQGTTIAVNQGGTGVTTSTGTTNVVLSGSPTIVTPTIASFANAAHDHTNAAGGSQIAASTALSDFATLALVAGDVYTGVHDFGAATSLEIPNGAAPTVDAAGEIAVDTTITSHTGAIKFHDGTEEITVIGIPTAQITTDDGFLVTYDAGTNQFIMAAAGAADNLGNHTATTDLLMGTNAIQFGDDAAAPAGTVPYITHLAAAHTYNVATGDTHDFTVNAVSQMNISVTTVDLMANTLQLDTSQTIVPDAGGLTYNVPTGDTHDFDINSVNELTVTATTVNAPTATFQEAGVDISPIGIHDIWIGATGMWPTTTTPCSALAKVELGTNDIDIQTLDFTSTAADERAQFTVQMPRQYDNGALTVEFTWSFASGTGNVVWLVGAVAGGDGEAIDAAITFATQTVDTAGTANQYQKFVSSSFTPGGTPADSDIMHFEIKREGSDALDTFTGTARLHGVSIRVTTDAATSG